MVLTIFDTGFMFFLAIAIIQIYFEHRDKLKSNASVFWGIFLAIGGVLLITSNLLGMDLLWIDFIIAGIIVILARPNR